MTSKDIEASALRNPMDDGPSAPPAYSSEPSAPPLYPNLDGMNEAPPSYDSLFRQEIRQVKTTKSFFYWVRRVVLWIVSTVLFLVLLGLCSFVPLLMVIIGSIYAHDCPAQNFIPIYLIVGGVVGLVKIFSSLYYRWKYWKKGNPRPETMNPSPLDGLLNLFLLGWFIAGCVIVFGIYTPEFNDNLAANYCHYVVYWFAFIVLVMELIFLLTMGFLLCCCGCLICCCSLCGGGSN